MPRRGWPSGEACFTTATSVTARAPIARKAGTGTLSPMDAYADRREAEALTHRQTLLIVFRVRLPTFMGSREQAVRPPALPPIGVALHEMAGLRSLPPPDPRAS